MIPGTARNPTVYDWSFTLERGLSAIVTACGWMLVTACCRIISLAAPCRLFLWFTVFCHDLLLLALRVLRQ